MSRYIQNVILLFLNILSYLAYVPNSKSINSIFLSRKKYDGDKIYCFKNSAVFYIFFIQFGAGLGVTVFKDSVFCAIRIML